MKINAILIVGAIFVVLIVVVFVFIVSQTPFPAFKYAIQTSQYLNTTSNIGQEDSQFMWTNYDLTLIAQAFVLFAAAAAALAMLRADDKEDSE
jgi:hypothetical protein